MASPNQQTGHQQPSQPIFPEVPLVGDPLWIEWAQNINDFLAAAVRTFNMPGLVTNVSVTANNLANVLAWNATNDASQYRIYRNTTGSFDSAAIVSTVPASKTGIATLTYQDAKDQSSPGSRFYWVAGVNERGIEGPKSAMVALTNFYVSTTGTAVGIDAAATGAQSVAVGIDSIASGENGVAIGNTSLSSGVNSVAIGLQTQATADECVAIGNTAVTNDDNGVAIGYLANVDAEGAICIGRASTAGASASLGIAIGSPATVNHSRSICIGAAATSSADNQLTIASSSGNSFINHARIFVGGNGQEHAVIQTLTELTTIAAAATTDTTIQIPAGAVVYGVSVRVTVVIPTAATFTVTGTGSGTTFNTAAVNTAANSTDAGTAAGAFYNATAQTIRITPNLTPAANTGRVRVTIHYYTITPPTS